MLSEGEVFDIAVAVQPERKPNDRRTWLFAGVMFALGVGIMLLAVAAQSGG